MLIGGHYYLFEQIVLVLLFVDVTFADVLVELLLRQRHGGHHSVRGSLQQRVAQRQRSRLRPSQRTHS